MYNLIGMSFSEYIKDRTKLYFEPVFTDIEFLKGMFSSRNDDVIFTLITENMINILSKIEPIHVSSNGSNIFRVESKRMDIFSPYNIQLIRGNYE